MQNAECRRQNAEALFCILPSAFCILKRAPNFPRRGDNSPLNPRKPTDFRRLCVVEERHTACPLPGMDRRVVMCAVDLGPLTRRVLFHAAGMAKAMDADLKVVHVAADASASAHEQVLTACLEQAPYEVSLEPDNIAIRTGRVSEMIHREARHEHAALLVIGARGHGGLARLLLGSTSGAVLQNATTPVLLVPPNDLDIVSIGDRTTLRCGPILAAVDLETKCDRQLRMASEMAALASQELLLLTVAKSRTTDHTAAQQLRERAHGLEPVKPRAMIVRRGDVAEEIVRCAETEGAGLVVMGLEAPPRGRPGVIASAVLKSGRAFVLAVPGC